MHVQLEWFICACAFLPLSVPLCAHSQRDGVCVSVLFEFCWISNLFLYDRQRHPDSHWMGGVCVFAHPEVRSNKNMWGKKQTIKAHSWAEISGPAGNTNRKSQQCFHLYILLITEGVRGSQSVVMWIYFIPKIIKQ